MTINLERFRTAIEGFDAANGEDPNVEVWENRSFPKELLYARRMTQRLDRLAPDAPEVVRLAARSQHICRWKIPRSDYPRDRQGYRRWRTDLGAFHAETAGRILRKIGYEDETITCVLALLRKQRLKADPHCQLLEDVACLVFLEFYFGDFSRRHDEDKLVNILRRTWQKMSDCGRQAALELKLSDVDQALIEKAVGGSV